MTLTFTGTPAELITLAKILEAGLKAQNNEVPIVVADFIREGRVIEAIKAYRALSGSGLKEAKDQIDAWRGRLGA